MKPSLMLLLLLLMVTSAFRTTRQVNKEPQGTGRKYLKIEQFYTPVENGVPNAAKRQPYSETQFDDNGNLTKYIFRPFGDKFPTSISTYNYENNRRVEQMADGIRSLCTYNSSGDTLELKQYGHKEYGQENTLIKRSVYAYGSNGKKSVVTFYDGNTDSVINKSTYTYNNLNRVVRHLYLSFLPEERVEYSAIYTYNSSGKVIKVDMDMPSLNWIVRANYVYNDKGWLMEATSKDNTSLDPVRHIYTYNAKGVVIKEHYFWLENEAFIDYVYTAR